MKFTILVKREDDAGPPLYTCPCEDRDTRAQTVQVEGLENWVSSQTAHFVALPHHPTK